MSVFADLNAVREAARSTLVSSPDALTAKCRIKGLPGSSSVRGAPGGPVSDYPSGPSGFFFDIPGEITVRFEKDGSRTASFMVATSHDDPEPTHVTVTYTPP